MSVPSPPPVPESIEGRADFPSPKVLLVKFMRYTLKRDSGRGRLRRAGKERMGKANAMDTALVEHPARWCRQPVTSGADERGETKVMALAIA